MTLTHIAKTIGSVRLFLTCLDEHISEISLTVKLNFLAIFVLMQRTLAAVLYLSLRALAWHLKSHSQMVLVESGTAWPRFTAGEKHKGFYEDCRLIKGAILKISRLKYLSVFTNLTR